jgi:hypothetical protein
MLLIYRRIPRKSAFRESIFFFDTTPISRFLGASLAFTAVYDMKVLVSWHQLVDMPCTVVPVKFDGGLSID